MARSRNRTTTRKNTRARASGRTEATSAASAEPAASSRKPAIGFAGIEQRAENAVQLALAHRAALEPRLDAGTIDQLQTDATSLGRAVPLMVTSKEAAKTATTDRNAAIAEAHTLVGAVHNLLIKKRVSVAVRRQYGVGARIAPDSVKDILSAIKTVLDRSERVSSEASSLGILPKDLERLRALQSAIDTKKSVVLNARGSAPIATRERNQAANRALAAILAISGAGALEFHPDPELRAEFEALAPHETSRSKATKSKKPGKSPAPPAPPAV